MRPFLCVLLLAVAPLSVRAVAPAPALVVVISIDQFRGDYLERFRPHFSAGGFNLLLERGAVFVDAHHRQAYTKTGPGHAVMLTGVHADLHGIIGNDWLDNVTYERISCVGDPAAPIIGLPLGAAPRRPGVDDPYLGRSPRNLLAATVGDELKVARGGRPKVIGIAEKDRAAILMTGRLADAAYFIEHGRMVSSTYYLPALPAWVDAWNAARKIDAYFGRVWDRLLPAEAYAGVGPDDAEGEDARSGQLGRTLPKTITGGATAPGAEFYEAFENTPFGNDVVEDFAETAIVAENLGGREGVTDVLCLGFSANDHVGHLWGPDSHEVMDTAVRTDRTLERFFKFLDARLGLDRCLVVLTADHGIAPMPERLAALRPVVPAGRIEGATVLAAAEQALNRAFGTLAEGRRWVVRDDASILLFPDSLREKQVDRVAAQNVVRDALLTLDFVQAAYTRDQLERGAVTDDYGRRMRLSFNRARSGDVIYQAKPYYFSRASGSNHGTPYRYDTHVPLVFCGPGVAPGRHPGRVGTDDLAPTLAHLLGLVAPPQAGGRVLLP